MHVFLERFLLAVLVSIVGYAITGQLKWHEKPVSGWRRIALVLGAGLLALLAAVLAERLQTNASATKDHSGTVELPGETGVKKPPHQSTAPPVNLIEDDFIRKYIADDGEPHPTGMWTVVISAADHNDVSELHAAAESAFSEKGYDVRPLFRSTLLQDSAALDELYMGDPALLKRIGSYRDGVLIGKLRSEVSHNASLDIFTTHLFIDVRAISTRPAKVEGQFAIDETGAGFSEVAATTAAEHRLADKLKQQLLQSIPSKNNLRK